MARGNFAAGGTAAIALCVALIVALHVVDPGLDPLRQMISEYAFGPARWMYDTALLALAAGSAAVLVGSVRVGLMPVRSADVALLALWSASLLLMIACRTTEPGLSLTAGAVLHGVASVAAFSALPVAAYRIGRRWRGHARWGRHAGWLTALAWASLPWLVPLVVPLVVVLVTQRSTVGTESWTTLPFGLVERGLAVTEVALVAALGVWASRACHRPSRAEGAGSGQLRDGVSGAPVRTGANGGCWARSHPVVGAVTPASSIR